MHREVSLEAIVPLELSGKRIDVVLAELFPDYSRSQLSGWLKQKCILIDGQTRKPKEKLRGGELVSINVVIEDHTQWQAQELPLSIVYENDELLIINKPAGLVVHPAAGNPDKTLVNALLFHRPELSVLPRAGIVHRLDKDTTGLMVVAKTLSAHNHLIKAMQQRQIKRHYYALVHGCLNVPGTIDAPIGRHPKNRLKMAVVNDGKSAVTHYKVKTNYEHYTLLDIELETGRTHQIRVHMLHIKHPIVGDPLYSGRMHLALDISRQALHAYQLSVPIENGMKTFTACVPQDFRDVLTQLEEN
jgi:23S rRNA pseudouridine1911/1915/1917 synthase